MLKKIISLSLVMCLAVSILTACSQGSTATSSTSAGATTANSNDTKGAPVELVAAFITGSNLTDLPKVSAAINEITSKKINATVTWKQFTWANFNDQLNLMLASSSEQLDLLPVFSSSYPNYLATGKLQDISSSIEKYGQGIVGQVGSEFMKAGQVDGKQFGVPAIMGWPTSTAIVMRKDILDKTGSDLSTVKKLSDLTPILAKIHAQDKSIAGIVPGTISMLDNYRTYDALGDHFGVLADYGQNLKVVDLYETQEYADLLKMMYDWNKAGYIMTDAEINKDSQSTLIKNGAGYGMIRSGSPGAAESETMATGFPMVQANICDALSTTSAVANVQWCVPINCKDKDRAVQLLNLMYSDEAVANLLAWGIEGTHYVKKADGTIGYPEGMTADTSPYMPNTAWEMGNQFITHVWEGNSADYNEQLKAFNKSAKVSKAMGFIWNPSNVTSEITAVTNVYNQYTPALEAGAVDPQKVLPEFIKALKDAGIDKIITEKQKQLDAWAQTNGVK